jgi:hypothetical protein
MGDKRVNGNYDVRPPDEGHDLFQGEDSFEFAHLVIEE